MKGLPVTEHFVQRDIEMAQLENFFGPDTNRNRRRVFAVHGLGGMGKTQLCVEYIRRYKEDFTAVFWLDGTSKDALRQSLANAAARLPKEGAVSAGRRLLDSRDVDGSMEMLQQWLSSEANTGWLLVLDNIDCEWQTTSGHADPQAYDFRDFLPPVDHGNVLITTRLARLQSPEASLRMSEVGKCLAKAMLESRAGRELSGMYEITTCIATFIATLLILTERIDADSLLDKLGGLPLALVQAGAYIRQTNMSVQSYVKHYSETWDTLMTYQDRYPLPDYAERSVLTTWKLSYEQVVRIKPEAALLLDQWAFLHPGDVSCDLLRLDSYMHEQIVTGTADTGLIFSSELSFQDSLGVLAQYSLVNGDEGGARCSIHPVVHEWSFHNIVDNAARAALCVRAIYIVAKSIPLSKSTYDLTVARRLLPHVKTVVHRYNKMAEVENIHRMLREIAYFLEDWESSQDLERLYLRALKGFEDACGPKHTSTLNTINNLGVLYNAQGKMNEAEQMYVRALRGYEEAWGAKHASTLDTVNNLGLLYVDQGKMKEAEQMYLRALRGKEEVWGAKHTSTLDTVNNLGILHWKRGKLKEAEELYMRSLKGYRDVLGPKHTSTLDTVNNLGLLYADQGKMREAEQMYMRALRGKEEVWGSKHTSTLRTVNNLGNLYADQGKSKEAEQMYVRALKGYEIAQGDHESRIVFLREQLSSLGAIKVAMDRHPGHVRQQTFGSCAELPQSASVARDDSVDRRNEAREARVERRKCDLLRWMFKE